MEGILRAALASVVFAAGAAAQDEAAQIFAKHVQPMLAAKCQGCHGKARMSGFSVLTREGLLAGGKRGPAVAPAVSGSSASSAARSLEN